MNYKFVVICHDPNGVPMVYGDPPFDSRDEAKEWMNRTAEDSIRMGDPPCDNEHDIVYLETVS